MECYLGEIRLFAGNYAPVGWHFCDGSPQSINTYQALFSLIGTAWGGDGVTTFNLPDLRGRVPIGQGTGANLSARTLGQKIGSSMVTITAATFPAHTHTFNASALPATTATIAAGSGLAAMVPPAAGSDVRYVPPNATPTPVIDPMVSQSITSAGGGGQPHNNLMPYQSVNFIIAMLGLYPSRN